jgi:hypothetical protein
MISMMSDAYYNLSALSITVALGSIAIFVFLMILLIRSGHNYSVNDTEAHAVNYAGVIREGHGGMTAFLWFLFIFMTVWTVVYFIMHAAEFAIIFAY